MSAPWLLTTLALFALAAHPLWLLGLPLPPWLLAACGLAALPLQVAAWVMRGVVFQFVGLTAALAYIHLYRRARPVDGGTG